MKEGSKQARLSRQAVVYASEERRQEFPPHGRRVCL